MSEWIIYMSRASLITGVLMLFYYFVLQRTTFHSANRLFLLLIVPVSLLAPLAEFNFGIELTKVNQSLWNSDFEEFQGVVSQQIAQQSDAFHVDFILILKAAYLLGLLFFTLRFGLKIKDLLLNYTKSGKLVLNRSKIIFTNQPNAPFSFFRWIFLPKSFKQLHGNKSIIQHEMEHARQWHSLDVVIMELFSIVFWFNPFVILLKRSLKVVHEYQADRKVVAVAGNSDNYLRLLVSQVEMQMWGRVTNHFQLTIKKRIKMITKHKSKRGYKLSYLLALPILAIMLQSFSVAPKTDKKPDMWPVNGGKLTAGYGKMMHPIKKKMYDHKGVDIAAPLGTDLYSTADGTVVEVSEKEGWGKRVVIQHGEHYQTLYAHMNDFSVKQGDHVKRGDIIGHVGNTGVSTGPHVHYEVRFNGKRVNPNEYFPATKIN